MRRFEAVVFDLWGTLIHPVASSPRAIAEALGLSEELVGRMWKETRAQRETGDLRTSLMMALGERGIPVTDCEVAKALLANAALQSRALEMADPESVDVLRRLRGMDLRIGLLSNCTSDMIGAFETSALAAHFDAAVFSCSEGFMKPNLRLYKTILHRLGCDPRHSLYVGDGSDDELAGAAMAGMVPIQLGERRSPFPRIAQLSELMALTA